MRHFGCFSNIVHKVDFLLYSAKSPKGLKLRFWGLTRKDFHEYKWTFMLIMFSYLIFQSMDMYKNEEIEYQLAQKQECFV